MSARRTCRRLSSPFDVPSPPLSSGAGEVTSIVTATRLLSQQSSLRYQKRRLNHVRFFCCAFRQSEFDLGQTIEAKAKPLCASVESAVVPHHLSNIISCNLRRTPVAQNGHAPVFLSRWRAELFGLD